MLNGIATQPERKVVFRRIPPEVFSESEETQEVASNKKISTCA
jgi:hypothetical protein